MTLLRQPWQTHTGRGKTTLDDPHYDHRGPYKWKGVAESEEMRQQKSGSEQCDCWLWRGGKGRELRGEPPLEAAGGTVGARNKSSPKAPRRSAALPTP